MLTHKQYELLTFIKHRLQRNTIPPSFEEMKTALGLRSKSDIHRLIVALEERGFIRRMPKKARALEVLKIPESDATETMTINPIRSFSLSIIDGGLGKVPVTLPTDREQNRRVMVAIPVMGRIGAHTPIKTTKSRERTISVSSDMLTNGDHFAMDVSDDSMVGAGICDKDTILIKKKHTAKDGDIIMALINNKFATLKFLRHTRDGITLESANPSYEAQILDPAHVRIQGKLAGLLRQY